MTKRIAMAGRGALALVLALTAGCTAYPMPGNPEDDYAGYNGGPAGTHFSPLADIDTGNVGKLSEAWRIETGEGSLQTSPLVVDGVLYAMTPSQDVIALDGATGRTLWTQPLPEAGAQPVRGLTFWRSGTERRLLVGAGATLNALDPATGKPIAGFGEGGSVDLRAGLGRPSAEIALAMTTPGVLYRDLVIVGFRTSEGKPAAPGAVRAYDVRTGALRWTFHLLPRPGEAASRTWPAGYWDTAGAVNSWAGMAVDERRGIVYVPAASPVDDFYGADRVGEDLYGNSLVALDAATGRRRWHYQIVHHDIWDRDLPSPPVLLTVRRNGKPVDAVAQATKHGLLFLFDRVTGEPLFPIEERPVPASDVPGERSWPTQPFPVAPQPFARQRLTADLLTRRTPQARAAVAKEFATMRSEGPFVPMSVGRQTIVFPGFDGGAEWGGQAVDHDRGVIFINSNDVPWSGGLAPTSGGAANSGPVLYQTNCAGCHGMDRKGSPPEFPPLVGVMTRKLEPEVVGIIHGGKGRMPGFGSLDQTQLLALLGYLRTSPGDDRREMAPAAGAARPGGGYVFTGYRRFIDPEGYPAVAPPWGTLSAIDMNTGRYRWRVPLGQYPRLAAAGLPDTGTENYGGPILTGGGLLFIGATVYDRKFRAFDAVSGRLLWQSMLPYAGVATPITYRAKGRQFVVIATSSGRDPSATPGSAYVAFALPAGTRRK